MPECGYEIVGGEVFAVSPAHEPHGSRHSKLSALLEAYAGPDYNAASDMLTRTAEREDFAPDGSIYPVARDPATGGRQLEQLAFEVVVTESLAHAGRKAASLVRRGVGRVFAIDVERGRGFEWSAATGAWEILAPDAMIDDPVLVTPLALRDLVSAGRADDAVARALLAKGNAVVADALEARHAEGRAAGRAEAIVAVLVARGLAPSESERARILTTSDDATLTRWLTEVASCAGASELLAGALWRE